MISEAKLWTAADKLRGHMDAADYKHVVLGLIFLKYISDAFEERYEQLRLWTADPENDEYYVREPNVRYDVLEDRDEYAAEQRLLGSAGRLAGTTCRPMPSSPTIGQIVDDAMVAIEDANPRSRACCPKTTPGPR